MFVDPNYKEAKVKHGRINERYIDYNRQDVRSTALLFEALMAEHRRHPIRLSPTRAYSPASVGKSYLRGMGVRPRLHVQPDFSRDVLGKAMVAYHGGRNECRIRRTPVPVTYVDFLSMYPTVNSLMGLWNLVTAETVEADDGPQLTDGVQQMLKHLTLERLFRSGDLAGASRHRRDRAPRRHPARPGTLRRQRQLGHRAEPAHLRHTAVVLAARPSRSQSSG